MWFDNDKPYKGTLPDDEPERDDQKAYAEAWSDFVTAVVWLLVAVICTYALAPIINPIAWALLK